MLRLLLALLLLAAALLGRPLLPLRAAPLSTGDLATLPREVVVEAVGDGDSLHVRGGERRFSVRLACIDAPELAQAPEGAGSRRALQQRLPRGSRVRLIPRDLDRYGRLVAEVIAAPERNLNLEQVADGQAFVDGHHVQRCQAPLYRQAEAHARQEHRGVWQVEGGSERPWAFRARHPRRRSRAQLPGRPSGFGIGRSTITPTTSRTPAA